MFLKIKREYKSLRNILIIGNSDAGNTGVDLYK
jgi:hypothetical protein